MQAPGIDRRPTTVTVACCVQERYKEDSGQDAAYEGDDYEEKYGCAHGARTVVLFGQYGVHHATAKPTRADFSVGPT
jgi:hypothetical protein